LHKFFDYCKGRLLKIIKKIGRGSAEIKVPNFETHGLDSAVTEANYKLRTIKSENR